VAAAPAAAPAAASRPAAAAPASAPAPSAAPAVGTGNAVESAVQAWASAWSARNMTDYFAAYAPGFTPPGGQSRAAWESERRARIVPRSRISVDVSDLEVAVEGDRATARFRQAYSSDNLNVTSRKILELVRSGDRWLIVRETTGS